MTYISCLIELNRLKYKLLVLNFQIAVKGSTLGKEKPERKEQLPSKTEEQPTIKDQSEPSACSGTDINGINVQKVCLFAIVSFVNQID